MKESVDEIEEKLLCKNPQCRCRVTPEEEFCSQACVTARTVMTEECICVHEGCLEEVELAS
jgi:hypothetical protein